MSLTEERLIELLEERESRFLKGPVAEMVSGLAGRLVKAETPNQIKAAVEELFEERLGGVTEALASLKDLNIEKLVKEATNGATNQVLQQLADMPDDEQPAGTAGVQKQAAAFDEEALQKRLEEKIAAQFEETKLKPMMKKLTAYEKQIEEERNARLTAEKATTVGQRNQKYIDAFSKAMGGADPVAASLALDTAIKMGYIKPSEDESDFVVEGMDQFGLEKVFHPAIEKLAEVIEKPELKYFIPSRPGTGTGSAPARNIRPQSGPQLQVLPADAPDSISADALLAAMKQDPAKVLADLAALDQAS